MAGRLEAAPAGVAFEEWLRAGAIDAEATETGFGVLNDSTKGEADPALLPPPAFPSMGLEMERIQQAVDDATGIPNNRDHVGINANKPNIIGDIPHTDVSFDASSPVAGGVPGTASSVSGPHDPLPVDPGETGAPGHADEEGGRGSSGSAAEGGFDP